VNTRSGNMAYALVADLGPKDKLGEGSMALADALGISSSPKKGGVSAGLAYVVFPGSGNGKPRSVEEINREGERLFNTVGGAAQLKVCLEIK
jgi:hypothetical protein